MSNFITAEYFKKATGDDSRDDDLERANCPRAGEALHLSCGWNWKYNLPCFMRRMKGEEDKMEYTLKIYTKEEV